MQKTPRLPPVTEVKRGNTSPGVNQYILECLFERLPADSAFKILDIPCGNGDFLDDLRTFFPNAETSGADILETSDHADRNYRKIDASGEFESKFDQKFDLITCISGVMEFDNTLSFFTQVRNLSNDDALFFITNDNLLSVRDRILYLVFGRFRQYKLSVSAKIPTWKILPLQNLLQILQKAGLEPRQITYIKPKASEWAWLPLGIVGYAFQYIYLQLARPQLDPFTARQLFPFVSFFSRHYVVECRPNLKNEFE